jgi:hypothetical protein
MHITKNTHTLINFSVLEYPQYKVRPKYTNANSNSNTTTTDDDDDDDKILSLVVSGLCGVFSDGTMCRCNHHPQL